MQLKRRNVLLSLAALAALDAPLFAPLGAVPLRPPAPAIIDPAAAQSDFAWLYRTLREAHFDLYAHRPKPEYDRYYQRILTDLRRPMSATAVAILFQKFVAFGRIGHARIDAPTVAFVDNLKNGGKLIPLFIRVDSGKVLLTEPAEASGRLRAGTQITAINGIPIQTAIDRLSAYVSAERPYMAHAQMERSFPALLWMDLGPVPSVQVTASVAGKAVTLTVPAITLADRKALSPRFPAPMLETDFSTRDYGTLQDGIAYLRPGPFFDIEQPETGAGPTYRASAFLAFIDDSFSKIVAEGATDLILDLRDNPGGDNSFSDPMIAWFATQPFRFASSFELKASSATKADYARIQAAGSPIDAEFSRQMAMEMSKPNGSVYEYDLPFVKPRPEPRFNGRVWVLVNRHSYSNAASVAALVQDYAFGKIVGEETADVASNYASVQSFALPKTGITVTYPKSHFVRPNGRDEVKGVTPDIRLERQPIGAEDDRVLNETIAHIRRQASPDRSHRP